MGGDDGGGDALPSRESSVRVSEHEHEREREHERTGMAERESARARRARRVRAVARTMLGDGCGAVGGVGGSMAAARGRVVFLLERTHADQSACARRERRVRAAARTMLEEEVAAREQLPAGPPQHVGPAGGARGHRKGPAGGARGRTAFARSAIVWRKMVLCSPCTALHRRKRVDTSCSCPQSGDRQPVSHEQRRHVDARRHAPR